MKAAALSLLLLATLAFAQTPPPNPAPPPDPEGIPQHDLNREPPPVVDPGTGWPAAVPGRPPADAI